MAGNYPDVPDHRMAIDRDGTQAYRLSSANVITPLTPAQLAILNNETTSEIIVGTDWVVLLFPELRDIKAWFFAASSNGSGWQSQVSTDTTNGIDGTWTTYSTSIPAQAKTGIVSPHYRSDIQVQAAAGIKGIRTRVYDSSTRIRSFHIYGTPSAGQNPDRLALWHPILDQPLDGGYFDWGDVPQGSAATRTFRVKNLSAAKTANNIQLSLGALTDSNPTLISQHALSADSVNFAATASASTLAPGGISGTMTLRSTISSSATPSLWALRLSAVATSWS